MFSTSKVVTATGVVTFRILFLVALETVLHSQVFQKPLHFSLVFEIYESSHLLVL